MPDNWQAIEQLPSVYNRFSSGVVTANLDLLRSGVSQSRYRGLGPPALVLLPRAEVATRVYIQTRGQNVVFLFIKTGVTVDLLLSLDITFHVAAGTAPLDPDVPHWQLPVWLLLPPFFSSAPPVEDQLKLAKALDQSHLDRITYLRTRETMLAATETADFRIARVARLEPGAAKAVSVYQRIVGSSVDEVRLRYEPATFVALLHYVAEWVRSGFQEGSSVRLPLPAEASDSAAQRLLVAVVRSWIEARKGTAPRTSHALLQTLLPVFNVGAFQGDVLLRLRPDGALAEKPNEDTFRLRMSVRMREDAGRGRGDVSLQVPDFLADGQLHQRLLEAMLTDTPVRRIFADSKLPPSQRGGFRKWLNAGAAGALVFRADKDGDQDVDVFVFRGELGGALRVAIAAAAVKVQKRDDDFDVRLQDVPGSMTLLYTDIPGNQLELTNPLLPKYLIALVNQLTNWIRALRGRAL